MVGIVLLAGRQAMTGGLGYPSACLIDLYGTLVDRDYSAHNRELPALAGVSPAAWVGTLARYRAGLRVGRWSMADLVRVVRWEAGYDTDNELVEWFVQRDRDLLEQAVRPYDDAVEFLDRLRARAVPTAVVSNCVSNTRPVLEASGLDKLVDVVILSCEVGSVKPAAAIFRAALRELGVPPEGAVFVDDQRRYCQGAAALGMSTVWIRRNEVVTGVGDADTVGPITAEPGCDRVVSSLTELLPAD